MTRWLATRGADHEWMDEETQTEAAFRSALRDLEFLNRITFAYYPVLGWLDRIVRERSLKTLSVLDVGAGSRAGPKTPHQTPVA